MLVSANVCSGLCLLLLCGRIPCLVDVPVALGSSFALDGAVDQLEQRVPSPARRWARPPISLPSLYSPAQPLLFITSALSWYNHLSHACSLSPSSSSYTGRQSRFCFPVPDGSVGRVFSLLLWGYGCRLNDFSMFLRSACLLTTWLIRCTSSRAPRLPPCLFIIALWTFSLGTIFSCSFFPAFGTVTICDLRFIVFLFFRHNTNFWMLADSFSYQGYWSHFCSILMIRKLFL